MNWKFIVVAVLGAISFQAGAQTTFPPIVVTAPRVGGGTILCQGSACEGIMRDLQASRMEELMMYEQIFPDILEDIPIEKSKFCASLKATKPANCNLDSPPPSPGIYVPGQSGFQANGCGTGRLANLFADAALYLATRPTYSGNFQAPYPGVSFQAACNGHDTCWAMGGGKDGCDFAFRQEMINACGGESAANNVCLGFSGIYHGAVTNTGMAQNAYNNSVAGRTCALWASNMRQNGCP